MKKILILTLVISFFLVGCLAKEVPTNQATNQATGEGIEEETEPGVGLANPAAVYCQKQGGQNETRSDEDGNQYGICKFSDGSECGNWAYFRGECAPGATAAEMIKKLLADKYGKDLSEVTIKINNETSDHARGSVKFGANEAGEGGNFLAAKVSGAWQLVFDGNGGFSCQELNQYDFPPEMISDCY